MANIFKDTQINGNLNVSGQIQLGDVDIKDFINDRIIIKSGKLNATTVSSGTSLIQTVTFDEPFPDGYTLIPFSHHGATTNKNYGGVNIGFTLTNESVQISFSNDGVGNLSPTLHWYVIGIKIV